MITGGKAPRRLIRAAAYAGLAVALAASCLLLACHIAFMSLDHETLPGLAPAELWAHRGYWRDGAGQNSLAAFRAAANRDFTGVEMDVHYVPEHGFVVQHDPPAPEDLREPLLLDDVWAELGARMYYYLDLKNLTRENVEEVASRLVALAERHRVQRRFLIESDHVRALRSLHDHAPHIHTMLWLWRCDGLQSSWKMKVAILLSDADGVTSNHRLLTPTCLDRLRHLTLVSGPVNEPERARQLFA